MSLLLVTVIAIIMMAGLLKYKKINFNVATTCQAMTFQYQLIKTCKPHILRIQCRPHDMKRSVSKRKEETHEDGCIPWLERKNSFPFN